MFVRNSFLSSTAILLSVAVAVPAYAQDRVFDIPAQPAVKAIPEFARQAGIQIVASARDLADVRTPAIQGIMDPRKALRLLIAGTPLRIASDDGHVIALRSGRASNARVAGKGAVTGRILNPATGEYLRNARVTIVAAGGKHSVTTSGEGGEYDAHDIPAGTATITVSFNGYVSQTATVSIPASGTARLDFSLQQSDRQGEAAKHSDIIVNGARESGARELMAQRNELQIADVLSTEAYGDIAGGNPAEFLKYMPGVDVDGSNGTALYAFLRGLPAEFTRTQLNGMDIVSANANAPTGYASSAAAARIFSFESISMSAIDSVTTYKTVSADQNADAPAGIIDLRTKHAYDRKKPLFVVSVEGFTHENMLDSHKNTGPDQPNGWGNKRFLPNGSLFYSNSFFNHRLGVTFSLAYNDQYIEREQITMNRQYTQSAKAPYPMEFYGMEAVMSARETTRRTGSLVLDYKANDNLSFSLIGLAYRGDVYQHQSTVTVNADTSKGAVGLLNLNGQAATAQDALSGFRTQQAATAQTISSAAATQYKVNNGNIIAPSFEWNKGDWHVDGYFAYSDTHSYYNSPHEGQVSAGPTITSTGNFQAVKGSPSLTTTDWDITQISGPDWSNPASYSISGKPSITLTSGAYGKITAKSGGLNAAYDGHIGAVPITFKTGFKITDTMYDFGNSATSSYTYNGPLTNAQFLAQVVNPNITGVWNKSDFSVTSLSGSGYIPQVDLAKLWTMYSQNPEQWTSATTAANYATANYTGATRFEENIKAVYGMVTAEVTPKLQLRAGLRGEWTNNRASVYKSLPLDQVKAYTPAGATAKCAITAATGIATTVPCVDYQFSNGIQHVKGNYFTLFPSASLKYTFGESTDFQAGYSRTILRPGVDAAGSSPSFSLTGSSTSGPIVTVPNPGLSPAISDNFSARLSHYFKGVGLFNIGFYYNRIKGLAVQQEYSADEAAGIPALAPYVADPAYAGYAFSTYNQEDLTTIKGIEAAFQHSFSWLPAPFDGLSLRGAFTHNDPNHPIARVGNNIGSAAVMYEKGPVKLYVNILWNDDKYRSNTPTWFQARTDMTISGRIKLMKHLETYFTINNVLNQPYNVMVPGNAFPSTAAANFPNYSAIYVKNGRTGTIGLRARF
ncbi:TonB-dependent receptor domain-containing protein [Sphingobium sp. EM0848]|uniref:TonB-dependent receptor domain-containing protein n=1 Tax=Sphingobium sp. EM0848 TaxID=2743473 RepID=UPI00159C2FCF|nr:TonB-dependent receptor [Sphingobium sp. EM0848]